MRGDGGETGRKDDRMQASGVVISSLRGVACACGWPRRDVISRAYAMRLPQASSIAKAVVERWRQRTRAYPLGDRTSVVGIEDCRQLLVSVAKLDSVIVGFKG